MRINLHFVAKRGRAAEVADLLRARGLTDVRVLPGEVRVVASTTSSELTECLGVRLEYGERETRVGSHAERQVVPMVPPSAHLPPELAADVERWYAAIPPDRL